MNDEQRFVLSKVPEVTFAFWILKILATTLGETGGDTVTMTILHADTNAHNGGYLIGTAIFLTIFVAVVVVKISMKRFRVCSHLKTGQIVDLNQSRVAAMAIPAA